MTDDGGVWTAIVMFFRRLFPPSKEEIEKMNAKQCTDPDDPATCKDVPQFVPFDTARRVQIFAIGGVLILSLLLLLFLALRSTG